MSYEAHPQWIIIIIIFHNFSNDQYVMNYLTYLILHKYVLYHKKNLISLLKSVCLKIVNRLQWLHKTLFIFQHINCVYFCNWRVINLRLKNALILVLLNLLFSIHWLGMLYKTNGSLIMNNRLHFTLS